MFAHFARTVYAFVTMSFRRGCCVWDYLPYDTSPSFCESRRACRGLGLGVLLNGVLMMRVLTLLVICAVVWTGDAEGVFAQRKKPAPVFGQYQQRQVQDKLGFTWEIDANGGITSNSRAFSSSHYLTIQGQGMSPQSYLMTADATQYQISGTVGQFPFVREVTLDLEHGTVRYLDTITNPLPQPQTILVEIAVRARTNSLGVKTAKEFVTSAQVYNGVLPKGEIGFATIDQSASYSSALFYVCSTDSSLRPMIANTSNSNYRFQVQYSVTIPPSQSITLLHGAAQQKWSTQPTDQQFADAMRVFQSRHFTSEIPIEVRRRLVNAKPESSLSEFGPLLGPLEFLAEAHDVERAAQDILVVGDESHVTGTLSGPAIPVETRLGRATIPIENVAAISGGAGVGKQKQLLLRSGEVLAGTVDLSAVKFTAETGLVFSLNADQIIALFTATSERDGMAADQVTPWIATQFGDRLALTPTADSMIDGVSTWGPVRVPLADVLSLERNVSDELPIHRLELTDGTKLWAILQGDALKVGTATLGTLSIPVAAIDRLGRVSPPEPHETAPVESTPTSDPNQPSKPAEPKPANPAPANPPTAPGSTSLSAPPISANPTAVATTDPLGAPPKKSIASPTSQPDSVPVPAVIDGPVPVPATEAGPTEPKLTPASPVADEPPPPEYPTWYLAGKNRVVATLNAESFVVITTAGKVTVKTSDVRSLTKTDDANGRVTFSFELRDASRLLGRFESTLLELTFHGERWNVPTRHIEEFKMAKPSADADDDAATGSAPKTPPLSNPYRTRGGVINFVPGSAAGRSTAFRPGPRF